MALPDFPDFTVRGLPQDAVEVDPAQAVAFDMSAWATVAAGALQQFDFTFTDANYIYQPCLVMISPDSATEHVDYIYFYTVPAMVGAGQGGKVYKLYDNPALQYINGDTLTVKVKNADTNSRLIVVRLVGTRYPRPSGWIHPPYVQFHANKIGAKLGENIQFYDDSYNTPTGWYWEFGDTTTSGQQNPVKSYSAEGVYDVQLMAWNAAGFDVYLRDNYIAISNYEYLLGYTEVDLINHLTVGNYDVHAALLSNQECTYLVKDYGAGYFQNVDIRFTLRFDAAGADGAISAALALGMASGCMSTGNGIKLYVGPYRAAGNICKFILYLVDGATSLTYDISVNLTYGQTYYCKLIRTSGSTTATCYIYSNAAMTVLVDTLQITHASVNNNFRYIYAACTRNVASWLWCSFQHYNIRIYSH
jgi:PKD repeat protein